MYGGKVIPGHNIYLDTAAMYFLCELFSERILFFYEYRILESDNCYIYVFRIIEGSSYGWNNMIFITKLSERITKFSISLTHSKV